MAMTKPLYQAQADPATGRAGSPRIDAAPGRPGGRAQAPAVERRRQERPRPASRTYLPPAIQRVLTRAAAQHLLPLLNLVASRASGGAPCRAGQRELAAELGRTERQVRRGELELERLGLLEVIRAGPGNRRTLQPTWFRAVPDEQELEGTPQVLHRPDTDVRSPQGQTGHACPVSPPGDRAGLLTGSRAPTRTQTENLLVSSGRGAGDQAELPQAVAQAGPDVPALARVLLRHAAMWRNTLPEVERLLAEIVRGAGPAAARTWLLALARRIAYRPAEQRGALVLGALRSRARQERKAAPGLFDRPLEVLP